jgi:hypothetical protein
MKQNILLFTFFCFLLFNNSAFAFSPEQKEALAKAIKKAEKQIEENEQRHKRHEIIKAIARQLKKVEVAKAEKDTFIALKNLLTGKGSLQDIFNAYQQARYLQQEPEEFNFIKAESILNASGFIEIEELLLEKQKKSKRSSKDETQAQESVPEMLLLLN